MFTFLAFQITNKSHNWQNFSIRNTTSEWVIMRLSSIKVTTSSRRATSHRSTTAAELPVQKVTIKVNKHNFSDSILLIFPSAWDSLHLMILKTATTSFFFEKWFQISLIFLSMTFQVFRAWLVSIPPPPSPWRIT